MIFQEIVGCPKEITNSFQVSYSALARGDSPAEVEEAEKDVSSTSTTPQPELKEAEEEEPRRMLRKRLLVQDQEEEREALAVGDRLPPPSSQSLLLPLVNDTFDRLKSSSSSQVSHEETLFLVYVYSHEVGRTNSEKTQTSVFQWKHILAFPGTFLFVAATNSVNFQVSKRQYFFHFSFAMY